jgi:protoporphyrinogen oxidase
MKQKSIIFTNGHREPYTHLISTMPLDTLLRMLKEKSSTSFTRAARKLLCNTVINFNLGIRNEQLSDKHWIYFPEAQYPFYRIGFTHNFARTMTPPGCSSLYGEFACLGKSDQWIQSTLRDAVRMTKQLLQIRDADIVTEKIITIPHAYVIYDQWRERNLSPLLAQLRQESIYCVGRYGEWKYSSMQEAVLDGKRIADMLTVVPAKQVVEHSNPRILPQRKEIEV